MIHVRPATSQDLDALTTIIAEAFNVKMHILFGHDPARIKEMLGWMYAGPLSRHYDGLLIAEIDGDPVGAMAIEPMPWHYEDIDQLERMTKTLSPWRQWWNKLGFRVFRHGPEPGDAYITDVGVLKRARGKGVGQALMVYAEQWAIERHRLALSLWVASNNRIARHVYERIGMTAIRDEFNWLSALLYRIPRWTYMRKALPDSLDATMFDSPFDQIQPAHQIAEERHG